MPPLGDALACQINIRLKSPKLFMKMSSEQYVLTTSKGNDRHIILSRCHKNHFVVFLQQSLVSVTYFNREKHSLLNENVLILIRIKS